MICHNCGTEGDGVFCAVCGAKLPAGSEIDHNPAVRRRAAEKAAEEAEAMRRRYEEAAEAAKSMLLAVEAEETAAAKARAEREEALKRAVTEAEALLADKNAKLTAAQAEQRAAERLLTERRAAISELHTTAKTPDNLNTAVYPGLNASPGYAPSEHVHEPVRKAPEAAQDISRLHPDINQLRQESNWPQSDLQRQMGDMARVSPVASQSQLNTPPSWVDTSSRMEPVQPPESTTRPLEPPIQNNTSRWTAPPMQNNASPWTAPPTPTPLWSTNSDPSQAEIWNTIVKNTPNDPDAENVLRKAAGYWKDSPPLPADHIMDTRAQQADPRLQQADNRNIPPADPWGLGNNISASPRQINEQQHVKQADNKPQVAFIPRSSVKQREEKSRRPAKSNDDFDEDNEADYVDEDEDEDDDDTDSKPSFFQSILSGFKLGSPAKRKRRDDDEDDDDYEEDDDDYEEDDDEDDYDDDEEEDGNGHSSVLKTILIVLGIIIVIAGLSFGIGQLLKGPLKNLMSRNEQTSVSQGAIDSEEQSPGEGDNDDTATIDSSNGEQHTEAFIPPEFVDPMHFASIPPSELSAHRDGRLVYCCENPAGIFLMNDDYTNSNLLTDKYAYNAVFEPPWIYFSTPDGIYRINQEAVNKDTSTEPEQIIYETYETPHKFYVYNNYLYYTRLEQDAAVWSINRYSLELKDNPDAGISEPNEELIRNIDPDFYMDGLGVYTFADESIDHADIPPMYFEPLFVSQPFDDSQQYKNIYFSSIIQGGNYNIGKLYMNKFMSSREDGVLIQVTENGVIREYMLSWRPEMSDYAPREVFSGSDGAYYELRFNGRGSYVLNQQTNSNLEIETIADDIIPGAYAISNQIFYYLTITYPSVDNISYKMMKCDYGSQDSTPQQIIDFGAYDQNIVRIGDKLLRNDTSFDKFVIEDAGGDVIFFAGIVISADRRLFIYDRTQSTNIELSPEL